MSRLVNPRDFGDVPCRHHPLDLFFPSENQPLRLVEARRVCDRCPRQRACRDWAVEHNERGVWGGTSERQRLVMRRAHQYRNAAA